MTSELLHHILDRLHPRPQRLIVHQTLDTRAKVSFTRAWAKARFEAQQESILRLHPDHPDFGRGHLLNYNLLWTQDPERPTMWHLEVLHTFNPELSPREALLFASATGTSLEVPFTYAIFLRTRNRMLGHERKGGTVVPALRPAVASVLFLTENGRNSIKAWDIGAGITTEEGI